MRGRWYYVVSGGLGGLLIAAFTVFAVGIQVAYIKDDPPSAFGYFTAAFLLAFACSCILLTLFLVTNTRRPRGIEPE